MGASGTIEWAEDDLVMISALEHYSYCPRQCALIHVEQTFDENLYTLRGRAVHERVDEPVAEFQEGVRVERAGNEIELGIEIPTIESRASNIPPDKGNYECCHKGLTDKDLHRICRNQYGHPGPAIGY
jgi:hypothetical protein